MRFLIDRFRVYVHIVNNQFYAMEKTLIFDCGSSQYYSCRGIIFNKAIIILYVRISKPF